MRVEEHVCPQCKGSIEVYACETCYNKRVVYEPIGEEEDAKSK